MARLRLSPELLVEALRLGDVRINGASFKEGWVVLEISGAKVPFVDEVTAEFTEHRVEVVFKPVWSDHGKR